MKSTTILAILLFASSITPIQSENWSKADFIAMMRIQEVGYAFLTTAICAGITETYSQSRLHHALGYSATAASVAAVTYALEKLLNKVCVKYYS